MPGLRGSLAERFEAKYIPEPMSGCWLWTASLCKGYGQIGQGQRGLRPLEAHRASWLIHRGPIPDGTEIDHLCRNRACVNPDHLEPVPHRTNCLRGVGTAAFNIKKTHCPQGHKYTKENTYLWMLRGQPQRKCKTCHLDRLRAKRNAA